ncbi:MmcQ/YjbR family DNA-binding protein [Frondihabitans cladoniiphilus]|uniref:MmcQ/YjbR family DNA-binding protein n=1 Tax=Frondihabitans cladoniiphilus TaxID=715785 RepID=A0ABP8WAH3_9MICO
MNSDEALDFCANLPSAELTHPFGFETAVFKVRGKVFAIAPLDGEVAAITLKAHPDDVTELVREHDAITRGYHMNKKHWITVVLDGSLPEGLEEAIVTESYRLVIAGLLRAQRPVV